MLNPFLVNREREQLKNLRAWATRAPLSALFIFAGVYYDMVTILIAVLLIAVGISAYILRTLIRMGKKGWVITYAILIGTPFLLFLVPDDAGMAVYALLFIPLILFYAYCWILRYAISEWLSDLGDEQAFIPDKKPDQHFEDFFRIR